MAKRKPSRKKRKVQRQKSQRARRHSLPTPKVERRVTFEKNQPSRSRGAERAAEPDSESREETGGRTTTKSRSGLGARLVGLPLAAKLGLGVALVLIVAWGVLRARGASRSGAASAEPPATEPIAGAPSSGAASSATESAPLPQPSSVPPEAASSTTPPVASVPKSVAPAPTEPPKKVQPRKHARTPRPIPTQPPTSLQGTATVPALPATSPPPAAPLHHPKAPLAKPKVPNPADNPY